MRMITVFTKYLKLTETKLIYSCSFYMGNASLEFVFFLPYQASQKKSLAIFYKEFRHCISHNWNIEQILEEHVGLLEKLGDPTWVHLATRDRCTACVTQTTRGRRGRGIIGKLSY